jgi:hypothetical protein
MKTYGEFHDGFFEGLWIDKARKAVQVYLSTDQGERTTVVLGGVVMLKAGGLREGNIIFEVVIRCGSEITHEDIGELYELHADREAAAWEVNLLNRALTEQMQILEVNPSYGGQCLILAREIQFNPGMHL